MDVTLDFEESLNKTNQSKLDSSQDSAGDDEKVKETSNSNSEDVEEDNGNVEDNEDKNEDESSAEEEQSKETKEPPEDTIELSSNQFENDLLGAAKPPLKVAVEDNKKEEESKPVPKKQVSVSAPIKIRDRNFEQNDEEKTPRIKWECNLVKNLINTALLKDLIDVKLNKEEEIIEANTVKNKRSRPLKLSSDNLKRVARKEDEDLDFEPESDNSHSEEEKEVKDPTSFPCAPKDPVSRSRKEENRALLISNLIRPFTVLQLKTMLSHCGKVKSIWINTIKSRCYVVFGSVEEATRARESLHGAVWPLTSPKTLNVDYAEDERFM